MEIDPKDIIVTHNYHGPGKGSSMEAKHLPTGVSVSERIPAGSTESGKTIQSRLLSALKLKIQEVDKSENGY